MKKKPSRTASPSPGEKVEKSNGEGTAHHNNEERQKNGAKVVSDWNIIMPLAVGALAVSVGVGTRFFGPTHIQESLTLDALAGAAFVYLKTDPVTFALPAAYFRWTVPARKDEPLAARAAFAIILGFVAMANLRMKQEGKLDDYALLWGVTTATYAVMGRYTSSVVSALACTGAATALVVLTVRWSWYLEAASAMVGVSAVWMVDRLGALVFARVLARPGYEEGLSVRVALATASFAAGVVLLAPVLGELTKLLLPIVEIAEVYTLAGTFVGQSELHNLTEVLMICTLFCQVALGYLGIDFLFAAQDRKNQLVMIEHKQQTAKGYVRHVLRYMIFVALPYVVQRTLFENINGYVHGHFTWELRRSVRIGALFPQNSTLGDNMLAAVQGSKHTVEAYVDAFDSIIGTCYSTVERKLFAVPKLLLLPAMLIKQPSLVVTVLPASVVLDMGRSKFIGVLTKTIERISKEVQEIAQKRRKIEQYDTKNEELIRRGALSRFTEDQWRMLSVEIEGRMLRLSALASFRSFINGLYRQDFLTPCYELVLAFLLEMEHITSAGTWVYLRVIEDTIDFFLTRPRMDAQLASLRTNMDRVYDLSQRLDNTRARSRASCAIEPQASAVQIRGLHYTRGTVEIKVPELDLHPGRVYAVTGANGAGKSSLFGIFASCGSQATMLPEGLTILSLDKLVLHSADVVEITQHLYCSLFTKPISWLLKRRDVETMSRDELDRSEQLIRKLSIELEFHSGEDGDAKAARALSLRENQTEGEPKASEDMPVGGLTPEELHAESDDWYGVLSGGQRGKAEFMRQVFMKDRCPGVLVIDEAFAPLDPKSKMLVQRRLKEFCAESLVLVIYHSDANEDCVTAGGFFDENLHFSNGTVSLKSVC